MTSRTDRDQVVGESRRRRGGSAANEPLPPTSVLVRLADRVRALPQLSSLALRPRHRLQGAPSPPSTLHQFGGEQVVLGE